jgi:YesN/AraC family two-component response regulator
MEVTGVDRSLPIVLIVDGDLLVRLSLKATLKATARVVEADDGERALQILDEPVRRGVDLVLLDHLLPRRSWLEILRAAKRRWPWIPVVILTGLGSEDLAVQALRAGASDYLRKPIQPDALVRTVTTLTRAGTAEGAAPAAAGPSRATLPIVRRALAYMREHFAEALTLADVAREARLSRFHFCRLFHRQIGVPFHEHLHELRVGRAKTLLADPHVSVTEVAYAVGFNDLSHFDRTFRRMVGRSPTGYRASLRCA